MSRQTKYLNALALACALSLPLFVQAHEGHDDAPPALSGDSPRRQSDGSVRVLNRGFDVGKNDWRQAEGKAKFTGDTNTASLKVSFFGPFYGGYHVAALDADYQWALVVGPDRSYCWILSRTKQLAPAVREQLIARALALGIDTQALIWVTHDRTDPQP